ncbi:MAG TPA: hypothetical protein VN915_02450 [Elusimicrobiota bacterium]|nr:hypothetical protein [Elusimicrobiota bacterium]
MRRLALAAALVLAAAARAFAAGPVNSPWPQPFGNAQRTSSTTATSPSKLKLVWTANVDALSSGHSSAGAAIGADGSIYVVTIGTVAKYSTAGVQQWSKGIGYAPYSSPAIGNDGSVYVSTLDANGSNPFYSVRLSTQTGAVVSASAGLCVGGFSDESSPLLTNGGTVYYTTTDQGGAGRFQSGCLTNVAPSGQISWENSSAASGVESGPLALEPDESAIFVAAAGGSISKFLPNSTIPTSGASGTYNAMAVGQSGTVFVISQSAVTALNPSTLATLWTYSGSNFDNYLAVSGNTVFFTSHTIVNTLNDTQLVALNATTGAFLWNSDVLSTALGGWPVGFAAPAGMVGQMTVAGTDVLVPTYNVQFGTSSALSFISALDATTGSRRWTEPQPAGAFGAFAGQPIPANTALYSFNKTDLYSFQASGATSLTVSKTTGTLIPESSVTITANIKNGGGSGVPGLSVFMFVSTGQAAPAGVYGYTDASGNYSVTFASNSFNSSVVESTFTVRVVAQDFAPVDVPIFLEGENIDHFDMATPSTTSIGIPFGVSVYARNAYDHPLPTFPGTSGPVTVTLAPYLAGTQVAGTGALGITSLGISNGTGTISSETYNKIESIQIRAAQNSPGVAVGLSTTIVVNGPNHFDVTIPTGAVAGQNFPVTIVARDVLNNQVAGYTATLALSAGKATSTDTAATGSLSITSVNMPPTGSLTLSNETFSTGGGIALKVADSGLGIASFSSTMTVTQPTLTIDHYHITMATSITVGAPFNFDVEPQDASSSPVSYSLARSLNIQPFLAGTGIAGSGSLGVTTLPLAAGATFSFTASQTYNKIENVQLRVTDDDGRVGITTYTVSFTGPTQFVVTVPTAAQAGVPFQFVVQAQDAGNNQVLGYNGTVNISAVDSVNTLLAGGGTLGVTSLNLAGGAGSSSFQSYTKAQGIRFRVADSGVGVTTISSSMTVVAGPAASLTLSGNPQSTIATVPSVLTAQAADAFNNPILGSTVTFTVASGSAVVTLGLVGGAVPGSAGVVSTQAPTSVSGAATAFFGSTTTLFSQGDLVVATLGGLTATTTIYNAVLLTGAGGVVANQSNPQLSVNCPASTWAFNVRMSVAGKSELSAADLALTTAAFAASANTFVSTTVMKVDVVRDASPGTLAGAGSKMVSVGLPFTAAGGSATVGSYRGQSILVPQSVLRVFKLNKQTSVFEMVLDGVNLPQGNGTVQAQVADPEGIFALGAPPFVTLGGASSGTVTTALASGAQAVVTVPFGSFTTATTLTVSPLSGSSIPALPGGLNLTPTGIAISINTNGVEPVSPVGVSLGFTAAAIGSLNPNQLRIARYDAGVGWKVLDSQVDTTGDVVVAQTDGFSIFELIAAAPSSSVGSGFVFPNPFRPSLGHVNIKFAGLPASAHIKVFTVSGRLLQELDADSTGSVLNWNGTDKDGRPLASGVYLAVVKDTTGGSGTATIKFAVQR